MRTTSQTGLRPATLRGAELGSKNPNSGTVSVLHETITDYMKTRFPRKTWGFLANLIGSTERVAKHRLSNARSYTIDELQMMLQSEDGFDVLQILMEGSQPKWWWWAKRVIATADRRRQAAELDQEILLLETSRPADVSGRRRIKGDLDAQSIQNRKFAQAETALGFLHQDVDRGPHRAVAQAPAAPAKRAYAGRGR
ncbi:MAG: hypothetical protein JWL86_2801 [Rhizobium sp.]|nr:hypothetical protein [Rhizobium sp.]